MIEESVDICSNRKVHLKGSPGIPLLKCRGTLVLIRAEISVFLGTVSGMESVVPEFSDVPRCVPKIYD